MYKRSILFLCFFLILIFEGWAKKEWVYPISDISEELKFEADAVVRTELTNLQVISEKKVVLDYKMAITILNENGDRFGQIELYYNQTSPISNLQAKIYNAQGELVERVKNSEINDYSATSGSTLFSDTRVMYYEPIQKNYPYTIEYSYQQNFSEYLNIHQWYPYRGYDCSVQSSILKVSVSESGNFRYKEFNLNALPEMTTVEDQSIYSWMIKNEPAIKSEPYSPPFSEIVPKVICSPYVFQMDKVEGSMSSWEEFGRWISRLNEGRGELDEETRNKIKDLVKDCPNEYEKVKRLYEYLQGKTRYVSIQVGIGGWQPFKAQDVEEKAYGDCKALSNYMKSLLKVAGIESQYTLVNSGNSAPDLHPDFVRNFADHVILMVPLQQDTVWLECTSKEQPCGFLGSFTDDRDVLCITDKGGTLVRTPVYKMEDNSQVRKAKVKILPDGNAQAQVETCYNGIQYENIQNLYNRNLEEQKKSLYKEVALPDFKIKALALRQNKERIPSSELELDLEIRNYASLSGDRLFVPLNLMNRSTNISKKVKDRKTDLLFRREYCDTDSIQFEIPMGFEIESMPQDLIIDTEFGRYESKILQKENQITFVRNVFFKKGKFPADQYEEFRNYQKAKVKADKAKLILKKKA